MLFNFILSLFKKKKTKKSFAKLKFEQGLEKWKDMKNINFAALNEILRRSRFDDFAVAMVHIDTITKNRIFEGARYVQSNRIRVDKILEKLTKKYSNISREQSDKMKAHIMNNIVPHNHDITKSGLFVWTAPKMNHLDWFDRI